MVVGAVSKVQETAALLEHLREVYHQAFLHYQAASIECQSALIAISDQPTRNELDALLEKQRCVDTARMAYDESRERYMYALMRGSR
jgi:hypothetical protein